MSPRVSIVVPTYNRAAMLVAAIESCLKQTFRDLEVIVVNDGSSDYTLRIARELASRDERIIVLSQANQGLPVALNKGFSKAQGEFWTWTSDDNRYQPQAIEKMVHYLEKNPDCDMVYTDFQLVDADGKVKQKIQNREPEALPEINVVGACFLYRRSAAERAGRYDPMRRYVEDWDYWLRLSNNGRIRHLAEVHYDFMDHAENLSNRRQLEVLEATLAMRRETPHPEARKPHYRKPITRRLATLYWKAGYMTRAVLNRMASWLGI